MAVAEWEVGAADSESPAITAPKGVTTATGTAPTLPATVDVKYGDTTVASPVIWRPVAASSYAKPVRSRPTVWLLACPVRQASKAMCR